MFKWGGISPSGYFIRVCTCTCELVMCLKLCVRSAVSALCKTSKWTREADAIIHLSLRFISQTVMCKLGICVCFACGIGNDLCSGVRKLVLICLYNQEKLLKHLNISLFCQYFMCKSFKRRSMIPGESYPMAMAGGCLWSTYSFEYVPF